MSNVTDGEVFTTTNGAVVHVFVESFKALVFDVGSHVTRDEILAALPSGWTITDTDWKAPVKMSAPFAFCYRLTRDIKLVVVTIDTLNDSDAWHEAAYDNAHLKPIGRSMPMIMAALFRDTDAIDAVIAPTEADYIRAWAESLPGWTSTDAPDNAPHPLIFSDEVAIEDAIETLWNTAVWSDAAKALTHGWTLPARAPSCPPPKVATCECGATTGERCIMRTPADRLITIEWMPLALRASRVAVGNRGTYPHNGAVRLRVTPGCAETIMEFDGEWASIVGED